MLAQHFARRSIRASRPLLIALCACLGSPAAAQPWDLDASWSDSTNPFGQFTVGREVEDFINGGFTFEAFTVNGSGVNDNYFGTGSPAWMPPGTPPASEVIPGLARITTNGPIGPFDVLEGSIVGHTPDGGFSQGAGLVTRWTAPNTETVNVAINLWDLLNQATLETPELARPQRFEIRHNGLVIKEGGILLQEQGFNTGRKMVVRVPSLAVTMNDTIDLFVSKVSDRPGDFTGQDFVVSQGAFDGSTPDYFRSMGSDYYADYGTPPVGFANAPQDNPNGDWTYLGEDGTTGSLSATDGSSPVNTGGIGAGWGGNGSAFINYGRAGGPFGSKSGDPFNGAAMVGHGPNKIVWTAPADVNLGGVSLEGFLQMDAVFQETRQSRLRIFKNDIAGVGTPIVDIEADLSDAPGGSQYNEVPFSGVQVAIQPGDTLTTIVDGSGSSGTGEPHFSAWDVIISEIAFVPPPLLGDYNDDGVVDALDYVAFRDNEGSGTPLPNDNDLGTPIGNDHYLLWVANYGASNASTSSSAGVPEPTAAGLVALAALAVGGVRRR